jgi:superfamily I DNA/RNA helicase
MSSCDAGGEKYHTFAWRPSSTDVAIRFRWRGSSHLLVFAARIEQTLRESRRVSTPALAPWRLPLQDSLDAPCREIIDDQLRLLEKARCVLPDLPAPYFAHMRLLRDDHTRDVLLGAQTLIGSDVTIVDWQEAPLASVFFAFREGEEYEVEVGDRTVVGTLLQRHLLEFEGGELIEIRSRDVTLSRRDRDGWEALRGSGEPVVLPRSEQDRARPFSPVLAQLDPAQRRAVELPPSKSLLVLGEAGYGKTTVALHRLAFLKRQAQASKRAFPAAVIVPTEGLRRLAESMLERLGVEDAEVDTFDQWIWKQARRVFADLPARPSEDAAASVIRFKRHPALRAVLPELASRTRPAPVKDEDRDAAHATREDLLHLWGDRALLGRITAAAKGALSTLMIQDVIDHTRVQFSETTEEESSHVDADRLATLDGLAIDHGTPMHDAGTMDVEDGAVLFEINRLRSGTDATQQGRLASYQHLVVDEAQEFAPLELAVLGRARAPDGALTIAGDERQQIDPGACFERWPAAVRELGVENHESVTLEASYRCPPEITAFGRNLFGPGAPGQSPPSSGETSGPRRILLTRFPSHCHLAAHLIEGLSDPRGIDPRATVAIICRSPRGAVRMERSLRSGLAARLAVHGDFDFLPGISVTSVAEAKGLEFDYVVVPDASEAHYPDTPESRRALYVAVTRAIHQVWLASVGSWSPILPG